LERAGTVFEKLRVAVPLSEEKVEVPKRVSPPSTRPFPFESR
jgi:hypothetical protein